MKFTGWRIWAFDCQPWRQQSRVMHRLEVLGSHVGMSGTFLRAYKVLSDPSKISMDPLHPCRSLASPTDHVCCEIVYAGSQSSACLIVFCYSCLSFCGGIVHRRIMQLRYANHELMRTTLGQYPHRMYQEYQHQHYLAWTLRMLLLRQ